MLFRAGRSLWKSLKANLLTIKYFLYLFRIIYVCAAALGRILMRDVRSPDVGAASFKIDFNTIRGHLCIG